MPHLSPMNWLLMLLSFWLSIMLFSSIYWWQQPSTWPSMTSNKMTTYASNSWSW